MADISRGKLFAKLGFTAFKALESATAFCKLRGNPYVEFVHWLFQLQQIDGTDLNHIIDGFSIDRAALQRDFTRALENLPRGASSIRDLSSHIDEVVERAWTYASVVYGATKIRSGHLLVGALKSPALKQTLLGISREFERIRVDQLTDQFGEFVAGSVEQADETGPGVDGQVGTSSGAMAAEGQQGSALQRYSQDLTDKARKGEIDPVLGRDDEIRQMVDILTTVLSDGLPAVEAACAKLPAFDKARPENQPDAE